MLKICPMNKKPLIQLLKKKFLIFIMKEIKMFGLSNLKEKVSFNTGLNLMELKQLCLKRELH